MLESCGFMSGQVSMREGRGKQGVRGCMEGVGSSGTEEGVGPFPVVVRDEYIHNYSEEVIFFSVIGP